ncbi:MAG TPA: hypothetical protein VLJ19_19570 [Variovorax sp.]|nr:hypothetical protein [Variovorax sp.]
MRHPILATLLLAAAPLVAAHAQSIYSDPAGRYTLQVPSGWKVEPQGGGVSLLKGPAYASVLTAGGRGAPKGMVEALAQRVSSQWQHFTGTSAGDAQLGGKPGAYAWFTGVNPRGTEGVLKIAATVDGEIGYAMLMSAPRSEFAAYKGDLEQIEAGFRLTSGARR